MTMLSSVECEPGGTEGVSQLVEFGKSDTVMHQLCTQLCTVGYY